MADEPDIAIAIKYDKEKDNAPRVIAKGMRVKAEKLREIARANNIPLMSNVALANALYRVEVGEGGARGAVRRGGRGAQLRLRA